MKYVSDDINVEFYSKAFSEKITQQFFVSHQKQSVVKGKRGLKVTVDPQNLETVDGSPVTSQIKVDLIELRNSNDFFRANAETLSDGQLLASGGSYFIGMECEGKQLHLKRGKSLEISFPKFTNDEMELFYGTRNSLNEMNWTKAQIPLVLESLSMNSFTDESEEVQEPLAEVLPGRIYKNMDAKVYYYKQPMTLRALVDTLNSKTEQVFLQTISFWPKDLPKNKTLDTNFLITTYGPQKQYILRTWKSIAEAERLCDKKQQERDSFMKSRIRGAAAKQLLQYYAPSFIQDLGWINCDRFFKGEQTDMELDVPITFNNHRLEYFIIYKSINGFVRKKFDLHESQTITVNNMPVGETISIIAFTKNAGVIYHATKDVQIERNGKMSLEFQPISQEQMAAIFNGSSKI